MKILLAFFILFSIPAFADESVEDEQHKTTSGGGACGG